MGSTGHRLRILIALFVVFFVLPTQAEIHRARSIQTYKQRFRSADSEAKSSAGEWTKWFDAKVWGHSRRVWIYSAVSAGLVGLTGLFPLLVIPVNCGAGLKSKASRARLQLLLSFAVGGLLGDVFLHLLPEAWVHVNKSPGDLSGYRVIGGWVLTGLLSFYVIERLFGEKDEDDEEEEEAEEEEEDMEKDAVKQSVGGSAVDEASSTSSEDSCDGDEVRGFAWKIREERLGQKNCIKRIKSKRGKTIEGGERDAPQREGESSDVESPLLPRSPPSSPPPRVPSAPASHDEDVEPAPGKKDHIKVSGWLNLLANVIDNFTHGLAVAGSYSISPKMGLLTTLAILLHEIPHEIGDFAILLQAGFDRWRAAKVQVLTATGGIVGAMLALSAESAKILGDSTAWILPFTAGGFINIALIAIVPELLRQNNARSSAKQLFLVCSGIAIMGLVTTLID